jgi:hypothetical protein
VQIFKFNLGYHYDETFFSAIFSLSNHFGAGAGFAPHFCR